MTRLIRGAPGDACGLICEGDVLVAVDGRSIVTTRFSAVSALLRGDEVRSCAGGRGGGFWHPSVATR